MHIVTYPNPVLTTPCKDVPPYNEETKDKVEQMIELMHGHGGIGLAAPQVNWFVRLFIVDMKGKEEVFIDPFIITKSGGTLVELEGCLSIPYVGVKVPRSKKVEITYFNLDGKEKTVKITDPEISRVIQHEYDHLDGILILDRKK